MNIADILLGDIKKTTMAQKVLAYFQEHQGESVSLQDLRAVFHPTDAALFAAIFFLKKKGAITHLSRSHYT